MNNVMNEIESGADTAFKMLANALQQEIVGGKNKRIIDFKEAYPLIEQHLARGGTQKAACDQFNVAYGYKLYLPQFRKLLNAERKRRAEQGEEVKWDKCGTVLHSTADEAVSDHSVEGE